MPVRTDSCAAALPNAFPATRPHGCRFISCDWGTTNLRVRLVDDRVIREVRTDEGSAKLAALGGDRAEAFRTTLSRALQQLEAPGDLPVVVSGMASSTIGWKELPYARVPFRLDGRDAVWSCVERRVFLVSGLQTGTDVMRGEETEALGLSALLGASLPPEAVFILPGTHSKHVEVKAGSIVHFRTFMTGELFDLMARHSVLRHSTDFAAEFDRSAFLDGVEAAGRAPLTSALFRVRTRQVLDRCDAASNTSFLSGLLIGTELSPLADGGHRVVVAAGQRLRESYTAAGEVLGLGNRLQAIDSEGLAVLGQSVLLGAMAAGSAGFQPA